MLGLLWRGVLGYYGEVCWVTMERCAGVTMERCAGVTMADIEGLEIKLINTSNDF